MRHCDEFPRRHSSPGHYREGDTVERAAGRDVTVFLEAFSSFYEPFLDRYYFWGVWAIVVRMLLTSALVFLSSKDTGFVTLVSLCIALCAMIIHREAMPYLIDRDNDVAHLCQCLVLVWLLVPFVVLSASLCYDCVFCVLLLLIANSLTASLFEDQIDRISYLTVPGSTMSKRAASQSSQPAPSQPSQPVPVDGILCCQAGPAV